MFISKLKRDVLGTFRDTCVNIDRGNLGPNKLSKLLLEKYLFNLYILLLKPALYSYTINSPILSPPPSQASPSSETQGRSVGPGEKARRKF